MKSGHSSVAPDCGLSFSMMYSARWPTAKPDGIGIDAQVELSAAVQSQTRFWAMSVTWVQPKPPARFWLPEASQYHSSVKTLSPGEGATDGPRKTPLPSC
jgi:hypothetical protein